jgi:hypothetical protein
MTRPEHGGEPLPPGVAEGGAFVGRAPATAEPPRPAEVPAAQPTVPSGYPADPRVGVGLGRGEGVEAGAGSSMRYAAPATLTAAATATVAAPRPAAAPAVARTAVVTERPPTPTGTVYSGRRSEPDAFHLPGRLHRLRIGSDRDHRPVPIRLFRTEPTKVTLVGAVWTAQMVAFRALATGARVVVVTADPGAWNGLGPWATGRHDRVAVLPGEAPLAVSGSAQQPILLVYDLGLVGPTAPPELGPWQTQITVLRELRTAGVPALHGVDLVVLKRLSAAEAMLSAGPLRLSAQSVQLLQRLEDEMVALLGGGADRYVWLRLTEIERQLANRR